MNIFHGLSLSEGIAKGKILIIDQTHQKIEIPSFLGVEQEILKFEQALTQTELQITQLIDKAKEKIDQDLIEVFNAHITITKDPEIITAVKNMIKQHQITAYEAYKKIINQYLILFSEMTDAYFKDRINDIHDVSNRIIKNLLDLPVYDLSTIIESTIIVIKELTPSHLAEINPEFVLGFITESTGKTAHSAIIARMMGIPVVSNISISDIKSGDAIIDGQLGQVIINPNADYVKSFLDRKEQIELKKSNLLSFLGKKSQTLDHHPIKLFANIASEKDLSYVKNNDADGIGLFRTEFLFIHKKNLPTEQEQFLHYKTVLEQMHPKPVIIRTLDVGGDKPLPALNLKAELNPFLGKRALRLCLEEIDMFKKQLRALLRASMHGNLKIMFPMVATPSEFLAAKKILTDVMRDLELEHIPYQKDIPIGIMVEIPSCALNIEGFMEHSDFFSIGTNDLIQYTMAADRQLTSLSYLYQPLNPAIIKLIKMVTDAAKKHNKWVGVCGEMASDAQSIPLLIGLGVDELSMIPTEILNARQQISHLSLSDLKTLAENSLMCHDELCVHNLIDGLSK